MDTKRKWYPTKQAWALAQVAAIDASLRSLDGRHPDWRRRRATSAGRSRLLARRQRMTQLAGLGQDDGPMPF